MNALLLKVSDDGRGGYVVTDPNNQEYFAADEVSLGRVVARLLADPSIPRMTEQRQDPIVGLVASIARRALPKHRDILDMSEPLAHHVTEIVKDKRARSTGGKTRSVRGEK